MESLIFHILSGADLNWLFSAAKVQKLAPNQVISQSDHANQVHLVFDGQFAIGMPYQQEDNLKELMQLNQGALLGTVSNSDAGLSTATLHTKTPCLVLSIDQTQLVDQLAQDNAFASRFYQLQGILMMQQLRATLQQFNLNPAILYQINVKEASILFAELQDHQLDWLIAVASRQQLPGGYLLQPAYRPIEALHIVLEGALSLGVLPEPINDFAHLHLPMAQDTLQEVARMARGDVFGELRSLSSIAVPLPLQVVQVQTLRDTEMLSIPHWRLLSKLLHDEEFARHFYRVLAGLIASKYQTLLTKLGFLTGHDLQGQNSDRLLAKMAKAEANFEWMVQRVQSKIVVGEEIQWSFK